jgi:tetratricopeptide (TPR) repeat protein
MRLLRATAVAVIALCFIRTAHAEDKDRAREAYRQASQHYDFGEYQAALDGFKEAYRNYEDPAFLFNIAQCHRALGHKQDAVTFYRSYLRKSPDAPNREYVQKMITDLEAAIAADNVAHKLPESGPAVAPTAPPPPVAVVPTQPPPSAVTSHAEKPVYRRWWLWTTIAAVVVVGAGVGITVALAHPSDPHASLGSLRF